MQRPGKPALMRQVPPGHQLSVTVLELERARIFAPAPAGRPYDVRPSDTHSFLVSNDKSGHYVWQREQRGSIYGTSKSSILCGRRGYTRFPFRFLSLRATAHLSS